MAKCPYCDAEIEGNGPGCMKCLEKRERTRKPPVPEQDIYRALFQDVIEATARVNSASEMFSSTMADIPSALPHPDGTQRIRNSSNQLRDARKGMMRAYSRLNDFLNRGIVPGDLKRSG